MFDRSSFKKPNLISSNRKVYPVSPILIFFRSRAIYADVLRVNDNTLPLEQTARDNCSQQLQIVYNNKYAMPHVYFLFQR